MEKYIAFTFAFGALAVWMPYYLQSVRGWNVASSTTTFGIILKKSSEAEDYENAISHMANLNPSMIDYEIRALSPLGGGSIALMQKFLEMIVEMFNNNESFELAQSYLALCLKVHEEIISENRELIDILDEVEKAQNKSWEKIEQKLFYGIGVVSNLRNYC